MEKRYTFGITLLRALFGILLGAGTLVAQSTEEHDHSRPEGSHGFTVDGKYYTCGSHWAADYDYGAAVERTRLSNPELYQKMVAYSKGLAPPSLQAGNFTFFLVDRANPEEGYIEVKATPRYGDDDILIFVDNKDNEIITDATIDALAEGLISKVKNEHYTRNPDTGVIYNDIAIFGDPPVIPDDHNYPGYIALFLLTEIKEPQSLRGGIIEGYFNPYDQTNGTGSNQTNILYIDSRESLIDKGQSERAIDGVLGTMAHEFQHLINYNRYRLAGGGFEATHWIYNEGLSEVASIRNGYSERTAEDYLESPNRFRFFSRPDGNTDIVLRGYERAMLWVHYLSERFGDEFLFELTGSNGQGLEPVRKALRKRGLDTDAETVLAEFWVANYLSDRVSDRDDFQGDPKYVYDLDVTGRAAVTSGPGIQDGSVTKEQQIKGHAAYLPLYTNILKPDDPKGIEVRFEKGDRDYAVHAVKFNSNDNGIEVLPLDISEETGKEYTFDKFTTLVFVIVNLEGDGATVRWRVESFVSGVEDYSTNAGALSFINIAPNPVEHEARFSFRTSEPGPVALELYDIRGELVRNAIEGVHYEAGEHSTVVDVVGLPAGVYTVRLSDGSGAMAIRQIIVVR